MRKFYRSKFNKETSFIIKKRNKPASFYEEKVAEFLSSYFSPKEASAELNFEMGCLLYKKDMLRCHWNQNRQARISAVHQSINYFSKPRLAVLFDSQEMRFLFSHFANYYRSHDIKELARLSHLTDEEVEVGLNHLQAQFTA